MEPKKKVGYLITTLVLIGTLILSLTSCAEIITNILVLKGQLIGNDYAITEYDNFGNRVMTVNGNKVSINAEVDKAGEITSYIDITIDGQDWKHVGSTLVFAQKGVETITDFSIPDQINSSTDSSGLMAIDKFINNYKNSFGRKYVVLVSSQTGAPICLFKGDSCNVTIPDDLPKMTLVNIDGKLVYIHRANVDIISAGLFN